MASPDESVSLAPTRSLAGLNHLALITNDMDTTVRFWHGVMGAPLVATIGTADVPALLLPFGESSSVAFFQYNEHTKMIAKPAGVFDERAGQFDHLVDGPPRRGRRCSRSGSGCSTPARRSPTSSTTA